MNETDTVLGFVKTTKIELTVVPCVSVESDTEVKMTDLIYFIGNDYLELANVNVNVTNCTNSYFQLVPDLQ